ncbi:hypothetical protein [Curtobacterium sp. Leaf261]|uniref:hypothetical protein n=1 Tax=Curtobacterium sp. Leaf261 TaxID=1736311 RepID=UPI0006FF45B1|nr:hypothetical protein [Curtobacterium sp. Leaf261]KQO62792.1 hypothetical protein ASF23_07565 [Curtobacterium sp. Leaf261]
MFTALAASPVVTSALVGGPFSADAQHWHAGPGVGPFPFVFPLFFLVVVVVLFLVFGVFRRGNWRARSDARAVLADRFARGDIDADEYRASLSELGRK